MLSLLIKWNLLLLDSLRKWSLTYLMILVRLNCLLINIEEDITSLFPMSKIHWDVFFASILLIVLCIISCEATLIITMSCWFSSEIGVMKWSNLLLVVLLKLFKCALPSFVELFSKFFLILCIWLTLTIHVFNMLRSAGSHTLSYYFR